MSHEADTTFILEQLQDLGPLETKRMFGGIGFFKEGTMFAMIGSGKFRMRADDVNKQHYESRGGTRFMADEKSKGLPYYEVPVDVLEDRDQLVEWAKESYEAALRGKRR